ncbi:MAG: hypothetical protein AXA67_09060 [Methylothermaceae bacteria B42]|nr:MAG: hypothetical protein AXA67_09060 [Methylothermaceae bacteria B42]HHJ39452.1 GTP cyclohydrolase II [Methylothermaceae bacterium]
MKQKVIRNTVRARIPTEYGEFMLHYYENDIDHKEHLALVHGEVSSQAEVPVRVHSECLTGDVFGSHRCDCGEQLDEALRIIGQSQCGVLIYLRQEGRGIGLFKKLQAYNLQDQGLDTVDANLKLGHQADERDYRIAALILQDLGVKSVQLITNNPKKIKDLEKYGIDITRRIPIEVGHTHENLSYLKTKAEKMAHFLLLGKNKSQK